MAKLPLVARDDVKEPSRPLERRVPLGDMGGLNTPPVPLKLLKPLGDDKLGDIIVEDSIGGLIDRGVV
jgi:hypothetical protein